MENGERVVPERKSIVAVAGVFILVSLIVFILIVMLVFYWASPDLQISGTEVIEPPKFLSQDRFSCFVSNPLETSERRAKVAQRDGKPPPLITTPLIAQVLAPLGKVIEVQPQILQIELFGLPPLVALSREKRSCKELLVPKWVIENKTFFVGRQVKLTSKIFVDQEKEQKEEKDNSIPFFGWTEILKTAGNAEQNTCAFLLKTHTVFPSSLPKIQLDCPFNMEDVELLLY